MLRSPGPFRMTIATARAAFFPTSSRWCRRALLLAAVLLGVAAAASAATLDSGAPAPRVTLAAGTLEGRWAQLDGVRLREFRDIPYAAPPVGALRWRSLFVSRQMRRRYC